MQLSLTTNRHRYLYDGLKLLETPYAEEEYAIAVKKGNTELLDAINASIANLEESGKLDEIVAKYITAE